MMPRIHTAVNVIAGNMNFVVDVKQKVKATAQIASRAPNSNSALSCCIT